MCIRDRHISNNHLCEANTQLIHFYRDDRVFALQRSSSQIGERPCLDSIAYFFTVENDGDKSLEVESNLYFISVPLNLS